ncbi:MAG: GldG family protein [Kiritimatiellae bacterium]|nr:GldG family protein [Kiritimatiellia bacterium]MDD5520823.1 GldG family protein [Kiritimatiellia bacterium]
MNEVTTDDRKEARKKIWLSRGRRFTTGLNVSISVMLAGLALLMVNYLSSICHFHQDISTTRYYMLSDKTRGILSNLKEKVNVLAFFQQGNELTDDVRNLLKEYEHEVEKMGQSKLKVEIVDPDRDLARARELKQKYDLSDPNVVVFESSGRKKYVVAKEIMDYSMSLKKEGGVEKKKIAFKGEQVFSSAIQSVTQAGQPVVYFLTGHGERDINDYNRHSGYSTVSRMLRRDNIDINTLNLAERRGVPDDCSALVIAGPGKKFSNDEVAYLSKYLEKKGRMFVLLDPDVTTGLEGFLGNWGVKVGSGVVVGLTITGRELVVMQYGEHPITRRLQNITTMFYLPRPIEPDSGQPSSVETPVDRPRVTVLASNTKEGWLEMNLKESPARFDSKTDRQGQVSVAVAVEKGPVSGIEVELKPARMVVVGDSLFVSNGALSEGVGGNEDFFMSAVNWLLERDSLMGIAPKKPGELRLDMDRERLRIMFILVVMGIPGAVAFIGLMVWLKRRI